MKLIHLSDLHIGKRVNEFSMLEDQKFILDAIIDIITEEKPDGIIIAGDVYDKTVPSAEAVQLLDDFIYRIAEKNIPAYIISGNHDSAERLSFGGRLMNARGIYISPVYNGSVTSIVSEDEYGKVNIYMLPFIKPINVKKFFPEEEVTSYTDAVRIAVDNVNADKSERNIIITHQFVTGASRSDSEDISVGGSDNVDVSVFDSFDYVALGHIHAPQKMSRETVRYCGTPLKYSFSEAKHKKSVTVVELYEKGRTEIRTVPLTPLRDMREIKGSYEDIVLRKNYEGTNTNDYIRVTLTDENEVPDAISRLRIIYPNIMKLDYDNARTNSYGSAGTAQNIEKKSPLELFSEFYEKQNNQPMNEEETAFISSLIEKIWEGEE